MCRIDRDRCQVVTFDEEPGKLMLIAKKVSTCEPGDDDCEGVAVVDVDVEVLGGDAHGWVHADKGVRGLKMLGDGDEVLLRCPERDTTMHVALDEADDTFLCPKHSVPLEKARGPVIRTIRIETTAGESAD